MYGVASAGKSKDIRHAVDDYLDRLTILDWDGAAAAHYAEIQFIWKPQAWSSAIWTCS